MSPRTYDLWVELEQCGPCNRDLLIIIRYINDLREIAWQKLLQQNPSKHDLIFVFRHCCRLQDEVWDILSKHALSERELRILLRHASRKIREEISPLIIRTRGDIVREMLIINGWSKALDI